MSQAITTFLIENFTTIITSIIGVVIAELALYRYFKNREKPKITITTIQKDNKLGFNVSADRRMIKDARVRCNNVNYRWENEEENSKLDRKDLFVGDAPSVFYPFCIEIKFVKDLKRYFRYAFEGAENEGIVVSLTDLKTENIVFQEAYAIPQGSKSMLVLGQYSKENSMDLSIRIIGEGIEEVKDYSLHVGLSNLIIPLIKDGEPEMEHVTCSFMLKKK